MDLKNTGILLSRGTDAAARAVILLSGKARKDDADRLAVEAMRSALDSLPLNLHIHLGEGEKDNAPMLYRGERLGSRRHLGGTAMLDLVVDPLECTTNFSKGLPDSMSVLLAVPAGSIHEIPGTYMEQILIPAEAASLLGSSITLDTEPAEILKLTAEALGRRTEQLTVAVQDRPRHENLIKKIREAGAGVSLIESGSISAGAEIIMRPQGRIHMLWGTFGAPEGLIMAAMANLSGFGFLGRIAPHNDAAKQQCEELGLCGRTLLSSEWISEPGILCMSGIHSNPWLRGVERHYQPGGMTLNVLTAVWIPGQKFLISREEGKEEEVRAL